MIFESLSWIGSGLAIIVIYMIISNTLWLLFGSRLLQFLPGVDIKGSRGTLKIAAMIVLAQFGAVFWVWKLFISVVRGVKRPQLQTEVAIMISYGGRYVKKRQSRRCADND